MGNLTTRKSKIRELELRLDNAEINLGCFQIMNRVRSSVKPKKYHKGSYLRFYEMDVGAGPEDCVDLVSEIWKTYYPLRINKEKMKRLLRPLDSLKDFQFGKAKLLLEDITTTGEDEKIRYSQIFVDLRSTFSKEFLRFYLRVRDGHVLQQQLSGDKLKAFKKDFIIQKGLPKPDIRYFFKNVYKIL